MCDAPVGLAALAVLVDPLQVLQAEDLCAVLRNHFLETLGNKGYRRGGAQGKSWGVGSKGDRKEMNPFHVWE